MAVEKKHDPLEQLAAAYGKKRAKKILNEIQALKSSNPKKSFSFVFAEDGSFLAIPKDKEPKDDVDEEESE